MPRKYNRKNKSKTKLKTLEKQDNTQDKPIYQKKKIPKKVKEEVWLSNFGRCYDSKCYISWCSNKVNVFNFHVGHDIPESKGGTDNINNLKPICDRCNLSMGSQNTIEEWNNKYTKNSKIKKFIYKTITFTLINSLFFCVYNYKYIIENINTFQNQYKFPLNISYNFFSYN